VHASEHVLKQNVLERVKRKQAQLRERRTPVELEMVKKFRKSTLDSLAAHFIAANI